MTYAQFLDKFGSVIEAFGNAKFPQVVLERIHFRIQDLTPQELSHVCDSIIDNCEHAPKTSKVCEFANMARGHFRQGLKDPKLEIIDLCDFCHDLRTVRAISTDGSHETLMLCECTTTNPDVSDWKLQTWSRQWAPFYRKEKCPLNWFKPEILFKNPDGSIKLKQSFGQKQEYWTAKVKIAEQFWVQARRDAESAS